MSSTLGTGNSAVPDGTTASAGSGHGITAAANIPGICRAVRQHDPSPWAVIGSKGHRVRRRQRDAIGDRHRRDRRPGRRLARRLDAARPLAGYHVHQMKALLPQFLEQARQGGDRFRVNVVQQQDALAARLQAAHGAAGDVAGLDAPVPIVGHRVGAENDEGTGGKLLLDRVGARQAGNAKERRQLRRIAECGAHVGDALVDLLAHFLDRQLLGIGTDDLRCGCRCCARPHRCGAPRRDTHGPCGRRGNTSP